MGENPGLGRHHTPLGPLIQDLLFGRHWDVLGETRWHDPSWPMLYWALLYFTFWTLLTGLLYRQRIFFRVYIQPRIQPATVAEHLALLHRLPIPRRYSF